MKYESQWPWPDVMFYEVFGQPTPDHDMQVPKDFDLCFEFVMRNMISKEDAAYIRERYEKNMTLRAIAELHCVTVDVVRGKLHKTIKKLRHPSRSRYLLRGMLDGLKVEIERARGRAYSEGYRTGYQDCKEEYLLKEKDRKDLIERIQNELPESICDLTFSNHTCWTLERAGITKIETLLMLSKPQIMAIRGIGSKSADEIFAMAEKLGFPLGDGKPDIYE